MKDFSVIVPIFNTEKTLEKCINSIREQSYRNIEIILINDGSTDGSPEICNKYRKVDSRIKVIHKTNEGLSAARNLGIEVATGNYIMFVDSDDYIKNETCEFFVNKIKGSNNLDIITSNIKTLKKSKMVYEMYAHLEEDTILAGDQFIKFQLSRNAMLMSACRNLYRREFLLENRLYFKRGILHEDEQWSPKVFLSAKKVLPTKYAHYIRIEREGSITRSGDKTENAVDLIFIVKELAEHYNKLEDVELKQLLMDYLVMLYLNAFFIGKIHRPKYKKYIDKKFVYNNSFTLRNKQKAFLFCFNPKIYYYINKTLKCLNNPLQAVNEIVPGQTTLDF